MATLHQREVLVAGTELLLPGMRLCDTARARAKGTGWASSGHSDVPPEMSDYQPKLVHLPGTKLSPETVLHRTLNKLEHIEHVIVIIGWKDGAVACDWSLMRTSDLSFAAVRFLDDVQAVTRGDRPNFIADDIA